MQKFDWKLVSDTQDKRCTSKSITKIKLKNRKTLQIFTCTLILTIIYPTIHASTYPSKRIGAKMIYDPVNQQILMYGGAHWENRYTFYDELWSYKYETNTWTQIETTNNPDPGFNTMITYIPERHQLFLFGGWSHQDRISDTWILNLETLNWIKQIPNIHPSPRSDASIAYDRSNDKVVLFSGYLLNDTHMQDTWTYNFEEENWNKHNPENSPLGQYGHHMVFIETSDQVLMYPGHWSIMRNGNMVNHGYGGNLWEYDLIDEVWVEHSSPHNPPGRYWGSMIYDSNEERLILFGGHGVVDYQDTWIYDLEMENWEEGTPEVKPSKRSSFAMCYDPLNHVVVLYGGFSENGQSLGDTWVLDCETLEWTRVDTTNIDEGSYPSRRNLLFSLSIITIGLLAIMMKVKHKNRKSPNR